MEQTNFGLTGQSSDGYDEFLGFGKKARRRRKARRTRRKKRRATRQARRDLKNDARRADTEAKRAQTAMMKAAMAPTPAPSSPALRGPAQGTMQSASAAGNEPKQGGLGNHTVLIVVGVLVVGGLLLSKNRQAPYETEVLPPVPQ